MPSISTVNTKDIYNPIKGWQATLRKQGYNTQHHFYPGMKLIKTIKIATYYNVKHPSRKLYGATAYIYSYPEYQTIKTENISYESRGAIYYDNNIEEKLGGEKITLGQ